MFLKKCMKEYDINRSKKECCCGGHNANNIKKNKNHNSTKKRLQIKFVRKFYKEFLNV